MTADVATLVYAYLSRHGAVSAAAIVASLKQDAERVGEAMARLLDTQQIVVAEVTPAGDPLFAVAPA